MDIHINNNKDKAKLFAKAFFPVALEMPTDFSHHNYPEPLPDPPQITLEQLTRHIRKLSPYKVHVPDGIPNIVLQKSMDLINDHLLTIFRAAIKHRIYYNQ